MMISSVQNSTLMYNQQVYANNADNKFYMANVPQGAVIMDLQSLKNNSPSNASTGVDMDSVQSGDSSNCWENSATMGSPQMHTQQQMSQQMLTQQQLCMMQQGAAPQQKQGQDAQQPYYMPVPMVQTPMGLVPLQHGSMMGQGSPMGSQSMPMAMQQMANAPAGMAMMQAVPAREASTPTQMQMLQGGSCPASPQGVMMQPIANGDGMQMMQAVAVIPAGMSVPGSMGMQMPMSPQGYMYQPETPQSEAQAPAAEKKVRLLENLLPGGVRRKAMREEHSRKVFVGGLNPSTTTEDLSKYFSEFGAVSHTCVITDSSSKASRGFGFVEFEEEIPEGVLDQQHIIDQRRCSVREYGQTSSKP